MAEDEVTVIVLPGHSADGPLIVGVGGRALAVTANGAEVAEQPLALVTLTVYEPAVETMIDCVVSPVDQRFPVAVDDVNVIVPPAQKDVGPLMVGVGGAGNAVTTKGADAVEQAPTPLTVTV